MSREEEFTKSHPYKMGGIAKFHFFFLGGIAKNARSILPKILVPPPVVNGRSLRLMNLDEPIMFTLFRNFVGKFISLDPVSILTRYKIANLQELLISSLKKLDLR